MYINERYEIIEFLGSGGNASVYKALDKTNNVEVAIKILNKNIKANSEKYIRFKDEIKIVFEKQNYIDGIIKIYEYHTPDEFKKDKLSYYTMPLATPINEVYKKLSFDEKINHILELAIVLNQLHAEKIFHRDIKPKNLYIYNEKACLADFGLVEYPNKIDITKKGDIIGAKSTMAPEMKTNSHDADLQKADVYSFAKTMWMLLTDNEDFCFDGEYDELHNIIGLKKWYGNEHLVELNKIISECTKIDPDLRLTSSDLVLKLKEYINIKSDFNKSNMSEWEYAQNVIFGKCSRPHYTEWVKLDDIIDILNILSSMPSLNHTFLPCGGGLDLLHASYAMESGFIDLNFLNSSFIAKPKVLIFQDIQSDYKWSYFRLTFDDVKPIEEINEYSDGREMLTLLPDGSYINWLNGNYGHDLLTEEKLPSGYKIVFRYYSGKICIFAKSSLFNTNTDSYDKRFDKLSNDDFKKEILCYKNKFDCEKDKNIYVHKKPIEREDILFEDDYLDEKKVLSLKIDNIDRYKYIDDTVKYFLAIRINDYNSYIYILNQNGTFTKYEYEEYEFLFTKYSDKYNAYSLTGDTIKILELSSFIEKELGEYGYFFDVEMKRMKRPTNIFTKKDVEVTLREGDDSKNNYLVVDVNGNVKLIDSYGNSILLQLQAVHNDGYDARNNYVGKYCDLSNISQEYQSLLKGFLNHLIRDSNINADLLYDFEDEDKLIELIKSEIQKYNN